MHPLFFLILENLNLKVGVKNILVIGSSNMDLIAVVDRFPKPGETIGKAVFKEMYGGKEAKTRPLRPEGPKDM